MGEIPGEHESSSLAPSAVGSNQTQPTSTLAAVLAASLGERRCCLGLGLLLGWLAAHYPA